MTDQLNKNGIRRLPKVSSRNWRNLGEPNVANEVEWEWQRKQREWSEAPKVEVLWSADQPRVEFKIVDSPRGTVVFADEDIGKLLVKLATAYGNLLSKFEVLRTENARFRSALTQPIG